MMWNEGIHVSTFIAWIELQLTLPKSNLHKLNNCLSQRSIQVLFSLFCIGFDPHILEFSISQIYFFCPNGLDSGSVDCNDNISF